jgi:hypothetical protein
VTNEGEGENTKKQDHRIHRGRLQRHTEGTEHCHTLPPQWVEEREDCGSTNQCPRPSRRE